MRSATPESCGNADGVETVEIQQQDFHRSHSVLEISRKQRDSHIPTAPTVCYRVSTKQPRLKNWVRWKSGNPKAGFPLSHRTDGLRRKEETPESVYNAPGTMCIPCAGIDSHSWRRTAVVKFQSGQPTSHRTRALPGVFGADFHFRFPPILFGRPCAFQPITVGHLSDFFVMRGRVEFRNAVRRGGNAGRLLRSTSCAPMGLGLCSRS